MPTEVLTGHELKKMLEAGLVQLEEKHKEIDLLNVFPVPDGDTGTNMYLTFSSAVKAISATKNLDSIGLVAEAASKGALMGARGNSGVILSQLLRGIAKGLKNMNRVSARVFAQSLDEGVKIAYKAVIKPVEGTILTVAKDAATAALKASARKTTIINTMRLCCEAAGESLKKTPDLLPELKEAGVVDAGGMGWYILLKGFYSSLNSSDELEPIIYPVASTEVSGARLRFPYCTELLIKNNSSDVAGLKKVLQKHGDSLMIVDDLNLIKVHIHTGCPGQVLEECLKFGSLSDIKINNMEEQVDSKDSQTTDSKDYGIVAVSAGDGIKNVMLSLRADSVINGGQTMNPSTKDLLNAVNDINAQTVFILPNNSNIIMTAKQVAQLSKKTIRVISSKSIPQGIAALLALTGMEKNTEKVFDAMEEATKKVKTGEITYAVRQARLNGKQIKKGAMIGLFDNNIAVSGDKIEEVAKKLIKKMASPNDEICTLYYGDSVSIEEAQEMVTVLQNGFPKIEFELHEGGQPLYYYILSLE
jgi:DAK2 domain fusion protein YloV